MNQNKLVRDLIPQLIEENGHEPVIRQLEDEEYFQALKDKLQEEVSEYLENEDPEELADIIEIIRAIIDYHSMTYDELEDTRETKKQQRGSFSERIFLEEIIET
jgi:predicted house-cleaning noncanonical NTP pyrophosphatase (MazG superfamily)